ncbi:MAG TPA: hypothetical protein VMY38_02335 [Gemmatimonadaceae bacterium]|nr:hypothetical protein [Gemmatimonadaceae bacterium]
MRLKPTTAAAALLCFVAVTGVATPAAAQRWNDTRTRTLVERATALRTMQLADTALRDYRAEAHGYVTFLAQLGEGFTEPPKIVKADELALDVYWMAPNLSKQLIRGRRDTLLLPTDINYHRDHLGIIQNNFPEMIRLGDGDEVRDVPHPLSAAGLEAYDFAIGDSLEIRLGARTLHVYETRVRPKDDRLPRAIGALYIDRETAELARMALSFTRAALKDRDLEDVAVVLENGLIDGRFWLPRRQEIEIRRTGTWLDYPARGIIRGRWEICCYAVNTGLHPSMFTGPEIVTMFIPAGSAADSARRPLFTGNILDDLPADVRAVTDAEVLAVQEEARALVRAQALARTRSTSFSGRRISDFVRFSRAEGLALGVGLSQRVGGGISLFAGGRYGFSDYEWKGRGGISYTHASGASAALTVYDDHELVGESEERSLLANSVASQEFGSDHTDPLGARGFAAAVTSPPVWHWRVSLKYGVEDQRALEVRATPATGEFSPMLPATSMEERRFQLALDRPTRLTIGGFEARYHVEFSRFSFALPPNPSVRGDGKRIALRANLERPYGASRLVTHVLFAAVRDQTEEYAEPDVPGAVFIPPPRLQPQHLIYMGGAVTGPGYDFHQFVGTSGLSARIEWQTPAQFPSIPLGRFGRAPARMTLAPYINLLSINSGANPWRRGNGLYPSVGLGALTVFDILRVDVARGLRDGRWTIAIDLNRDFWPVL